MMLGTKGSLNCDNCLPKVLKGGGITFECTHKLVVLGKPIAVDSASPPSGGLASSRQDLCTS